MNDRQNKELVQYRFGKALETINEVEFLCENHFWNNAINRLYYSCFYAVGALLASIKVYPKTHSGANQMFALHFIKPGTFSKEDHKLFTTLLDMRQDADYEDFVDYEEEDVMPILDRAKEFIKRVQNYIGSFLI